MSAVLTFVNHVSYHLCNAFIASMHAVSEAEYAIIILKTKSVCSSVVQHSIVCCGYTRVLTTLSSSVSVVCSLTSCLNGGLCCPEAMRCVCPPGYTGDRCEKCKFNQLVYQVIDVVIKQARPTL